MLSECNRAVTAAAHIDRSGEIVARLAPRRFILMPSSIRIHDDDSSLQGGPDTAAARRRGIRPAWVVLGAVVVGSVLAGCSSGSATPSTSSSSTAAAAASTTKTAPPSSTPTTAAAAAATGNATCPTAAQVNTALGASYSGPVSRPSPDNAIVCEYTGNGGANTGSNAGVTVFANQSSAVFAGQVAHAQGAPAMPAISGVGDGAYGAEIGGRSIVNAYSNSSRTLAFAQAAGPLPPVEALARIALSDN